MLYAKIALGLALAAVIGWFVRIDSLRAKHLETVNAVVFELKAGGYKFANEKTAAGFVKQSVSDRDKARKERDNALVVIDLQTASMRALGEEAAENARRAAANQKMIAAVTQERDRWIKTARDAATRTERHSAEQEAAECDSVLNDLYNSGF